MTRIPPLGPRGEGWLVLQFVLMGLVIVGAWVGPAFAVGSDTLVILRIAGALAILSGIGLIAVASALLREARAFHALPRPTTTGALVDAGPYRFVRHPIYSGLVLACLGAAIYQQSLLALAFAIALLVVLDLKRRREEAWLQERFVGYARYRARTKALLPLVY